MTFPRHVKIVEVGPRDGLQNEPGFVSADVKVELIERLAEAGARTIEAGSFVSPKWAPRMADTAEVFRRVRRMAGVSYSALVPNEKGLDAAIAAGVEEVAVFASGSEAFSLKNINCGVEESLARFAPVLAKARENGVRVRGYVSCVLGCPYQGEVPAGDVARISGQLIDMGCYEVSLGDTIGVGTPRAAAGMVGAVLEKIPVERVALHFHDTYGQALANIYACLDSGVTTFDSSVGGLGGCPYAKGASGNVATEDLVYMLDGMGVATGIDLPRLVETSVWISKQLGRPILSHVAKARAAPA
jgi:hydroxymethylglutaryl-CoA lyase